MNLRESAGKAMFAVDWPKDSWERLGDGYHQDRYRKMADAAILAMFNHLAANVSEGMKEYGAEAGADARDKARAYNASRGLAGIADDQWLPAAFIAMIEQAKREYEEAKGCN